MPEEGPEVTSETEATEKKGRRRGTRRPTGRAPATEGRTGILQVLWGDLRGRRIERPLTDYEVACIEADEEDERARIEAENNRIGISDEHMDHWRQRYGAGLG